MPADDLLARTEPAPSVYKPVYYFFYGTLTKPDILEAVLCLDSEPVLRSAEICGYELTNWGQYRALIDGEPGTVVTGCAYMVQSAEEEFKLAYYETNAYTLEGCEIYFTDGPDDGREDDKPTFGKTFMYAGDAQALKQGRFDWALWERQMGRRLPLEWHRRREKEAEESRAEQSGLYQDEIRPQDVGIETKGSEAGQTEREDSEVNRNKQNDQEIDRSSTAVV